MEHAGGLKHGNIKARLGPLAAAVLLLSCARPRSSSAPSATCFTLAPAGADVLLLDQAVGRTSGDGCEGVGGSLIVVARSGLLTANVEWQDARARLKAELWQGSFRERLAVSAATPDLCARVSANVSQGEYVLRVCHRPDSNAPLGGPAYSEDYTRYQSQVIRP